MNQLSLYIDQLVAYTDSHIFLGNTLTACLIAILLAIGTYLLLYLFKTVAVRKLETLTSHTETSSDDAIIKSIERIPNFSYAMISIYVGSLALTMAPRLDKTINALFIILVISQIGIMIKHIIMHMLVTHPSWQSNSSNTISLVRITLTVAIWSIVVLLILSNLGFAITPLLTSLGIAGVAVAFALQNILEDLFSSVSIYLDKPFHIGDFVEVEGVVGTVDAIGIKTTRIKTVRGEEVVIANRHIIDKVLRNYGKIDNRTIKRSIGVTYDTDPKKLKQIPDLLQQAIEQADHTTFDRAHFTTFGDYALVFEYMYTIDDKEYLTHLNVQQQINNAIVEIFANNKITIAYPTQKVLLDQQAKKK